MKSLRAACEWKDQDFGNTKGCVFACLMRNGAELVRQDLFGICRADGKTGWKKVERIFETKDPFMEQIRKGDRIIFKYRVGGGGGHSLQIRSFRSELEVKTAHMAVTRVEVRAGALVDQIVFKFADGTEECYGNAGGDEQPAFELQAGELVTKVCGRQGDSLDGIQFHTSTGRASQFYGNPNGGAAFELVAPSGNHVVGIVRASGDCGRVAQLVYAEVGAGAPTTCSTPAAAASASASDLPALIKKLFAENVAAGMSPNDAAAKALQEAKSKLSA